MYKTISNENKKKLRPMIDRSVYYIDNDGRIKITLFSIHLERSIIVAIDDSNFVIVAMIWTCDTLNFHKTFPEKSVSSAKARYPFRSVFPNETKINIRVSASTSAFVLQIQRIEPGAIDASTKHEIIEPEKESAIGMKTISPGFRFG